MALGRIPTIISPMSDPKPLLRVLVHGWGLSPELACRIIMTRDALRCEGRPLIFQVISGRRTAEDQAELRRRGRPAAPPDRSTHVPCPGSDYATGVDMKPIPEQQESWILLGTAAESQGLRWGGGTPRIQGIPKDAAHFDLGPKDCG